MNMGHIYLFKSDFSKWKWIAMISQNLSSKIKNLNLLTSRVRDDPWWRQSRSQKHKSSQVKEENDPKQHCQHTAPFLKH